MENKFCPKCGAPLEADTKFCKQCGAPTTPAEATAAAPAAAEVPVKKKKGHKKLIFAAIIVVVIIIVIIASNSSYNPEADVKNMVFDEFGSETLGRAVDSSTLTNVKWSHEKISDKQYTVTLSAFIPDLYKNYDYVFDVNYSGDKVYVSLNHISDGNSTYDDMISVPLLVSYIYGTDGW